MRVAAAWRLIDDGPMVVLSEQLNRPKGWPALSGRTVAIIARTLSGVNRSRWSSLWPRIWKLGPSCAPAAGVLGPVLVLLALAAPAVVRSAAIADAVSESPPEVIFRAGASRAGQAAAERCRRVLTERGARLVAGILPVDRHPAPIVCHLLDTETFQLRFGTVLPDWGIGVALPGGREIALDHERSRSAGRPLAEIFLHELAHALLEQGLGAADVPAWFHEGVAMWHSGEWRFVDTFSLVLNGTVLPLWRLEERFPANADWAGQAYRTSLLAMEALRKWYGGDVVPRVVAATERSGDFAEAFTETTGETIDDFTERFAASVHHRFGWLIMLSNWPALFILLSLLFVIGAAARFVRSRKKLAGWPDDDDAGSGGGDGESESRYR